MMPGMRIKSVVFRLAFFMLFVSVAPRAFSACAAPEGMGPVQGATAIIDGLTEKLKTVHSEAAAKDVIP